MRASSVDQIIIEVLSKENAHLTSHQVFEIIRERLPAVNQSTVYRSLERLVNRGKVSVSDMGLGSSVFEMVTDGLHHHLVCQKCGHVFTIQHEIVGNLFKQIEDSYNFEVTTNHLVLFGTCGHCAVSDDKKMDDSV